MEKKESSCAVGGNINWYSHFKKTVWRSLKKLNINSAIPLLSIYLKKIKTLIQKAMYIPVFAAALFIIPKILKQLQCLSRDERIKKIGFTHTHTHTYTQWNNI